MYRINKKERLRIKSYRKIECEYRVDKKSECRYRVDRRSECGYRVAKKTVVRKLCVGFLSARRGEEHFGKLVPLSVIILYTSLEQWYGYHSFQPTRDFQAIFTVRILKSAMNYVVHTVYWHITVV